jgi:hypothetical protein
MRFNTFNLAGLMVFLTFFSRYWFGLISEADGQIKPISAGLIGVLEN